MHLNLHTGVRGSQSGAMKCYQARPQQQCVWLAHRGPHVIAAASRGTMPRQEACIGAANCGRSSQRSQRVTRVQLSLAGTSLVRSQLGPFFEEFSCVALHLVRFNGHLQHTAKLGAVCALLWLLVSHFSSTLASEAGGRVEQTTLS